MRRIFGYELLMLTAAVVLTVGCSNSSSPDLADGSAEAGYGPVLPYAPEATDLATGEKVGDPATAKQEPALPELPDGVDSDEPGSYLAAPAGQTDAELSESVQPSGQLDGNAETPKGNGRVADGDDPEAPLIVANKVELPDDVPLDNGREPTATPIPEEQRVAVESVSVAPDASALGRDPNAQPGDESPKPAKATLTPEPAAPTRKTLADLSEAIQALDKDGDGQLGVYEWPREKLAEFKTLDTDKDGFLTPAELVAGQKRASDAEAAKTENEPVASGEVKAAEKAKEEAAPKTDDSAKQEDAKAPAADTTDKEETKAEAKDETKEESKEESKDETPADSADAADSKDDSSADDQPEQGS